MLKNILKNSIRQASYGGRHTSVLIPGDGIGPEMAAHLKNTFDLIQAPIDFETIDLNTQTWSEEKYNYAITAIKRSGSAIKGNISSYKKGDEKFELREAKNQRLRVDLDLFANVIHAKSYDGILNRNFKNLDIYLVRQNTEGEYSGLEHELIPGVVESLKIMTKEECLRISKFAFEFAKTHNRKKVTAVHKANIMKEGDGLFLKAAREVAADYPEIEFNDMIVDNTCMQLVSNPWQFDVMLLPNLYGNIVGNVCCGLVGGAGLIAGQNYSTENITAPSRIQNFGASTHKNKGNKHFPVGLFEMATRNTGESIKNLNLANPTAFLMAGVKLLEYHQCYYHANLIRPAISKTLNVDRIQTKDVGGSNSTNEFMSQFNDNLRQAL